MHQIAGDELVQDRRELGRPGAEHVGQQRGGELGAEHGGGADRLLGGGAEPVHPGPDQSLEHLGELRAGRLAQQPGAVLADQGARLEQRGQPLLEEQRVAVGAGEHGRENLGTGAAGTADGTGDLADERLGERLLGARGQRPEHDPTSRRGVGQGRDLLAARVRPAGREHQQRPAGGELREFERESQRGRVGPVQVLEDQDGRARDREPGHHRAERGERHPLQVLGAHPAGRGPDRRCPSSAPAAGAGSRSPSGWSALVRGQAGAWRRARPAPPRPSWPPAAGRARRGSRTRRRRRGPRARAAACRCPRRPRR